VDEGLGKEIRGAMEEGQTRDWAVRLQPVGAGPSKVDVEDGTGVVVVVVVVGGKTTGGVEVVVVVVGKTMGVVVVVVIATGGKTVVKEEDGVIVVVGATTNDEELEPSPVGLAGETIGGSASEIEFVVEDPTTLLDSGTGDTVTSITEMMVAVAVSLSFGPDTVMKSTLVNDVVVVDSCGTGVTTIVDSTRVVVSDEEESDGKTGSNVAPVSLEDEEEESDGRTGSNVAPVSTGDETDGVTVGAMFDVVSERLLNGCDEEMELAEDVPQR
jgi:hypothetical protein